MATKSELNSTQTELNATKKELNSNKTELNPTKIELNSTKKEPISDETEYELRKKRETITSWLEFIPVVAICTVSAAYFAFTLKEMIFEPGGAGGAMVPPDFGGFCPSNSTVTPGFSDPPTALERGTTKMVGLSLSLVLWVSFTYRTRAIVSRGLYIFTPFFTAVYNQERLILETIYQVNK